MKSLAAIGVVALLTGCASNEYAAYIRAHEAQAVAQAARYQALAEIARSGDTTAKVAAVISLQQGGQQGSQQSFIAPPKSLSEQMLQWAGLIAPTLTQVYAIRSQTSVALANSNNNAAIARSTNEAFVGIAGKIQAPAANVTTNTTTNTATNTVGRDGVIGEGAMTRTCASGSGGSGASGAPGGSATVAPAVSAEGPGSATATGGSGALGGAGGAGGALNC